jgi:diguanylate cyclase (GGDEF)-like protein
VTRPESSSPEVDSSLKSFLRSFVRESKHWIGPISGIASTYIASRYVGSWAAAFVSGFWIVVISRVWSRMVAILRGSIEAYRRLALMDDLTGLANNRSFRAALQLASTRSDGPRPGLILALVDVDQFKAYNDTFGHPSGDAALKEFSRILCEAAGESAPVYRVGGDEFAVIMRSLDGPRGFEVAERMRAAVEVHPWPGRPITASLGLSTMDRVGPEDDPSTPLERADRALYLAKRCGGNKVVFGDEEGSSPA